MQMERFFNLLPDAVLVNCLTYQVKKNRLICQTSYLARRPGRKKY
ncbi:MAG: hypothetical protein OJF59_000121 [Cytophagales bacterium]|nr:MAG: hypothetical protein OJF59_000121 [Cytophagales bacterium]